MGDDRNFLDDGSAATAAALAVPGDLHDLTDGPDMADLAQAMRLLYGRPLRIVLVTDDDTTADQFADAAEESVLEVRMQVVSGVDAALEHLSSAWSPRSGTSDVVVSALDVDDSHRLLEAWRPSTAADAVPIVVLSDDARPGLERRSFALGAAGHLHAPDSLYGRVALIHALPDFLPQFRPVR